MADPRGDEVTPIIKYMAGEMSRNAASDTAKKIRRLNSFDVHGCIRDFQELPIWVQFLSGSSSSQCYDTYTNMKMSAFAIWGWEVRQDGPWDHKPIIRKSFHPVVPNGEQHWHHRDGWLYYYDVWSNIHYGYVGVACGFTSSELLDGAGLEQVASTLLRGKWPVGSEGVAGLRRFDTQTDRAAISLGISLYPDISLEELDGAVRSSTSLERRRLSP